ncbi:MAG: serine/threonine kinase, partial [Ruminococcus sp.]|nr:serine/threonine kinase [Ruminococcus sp.]
MKQLCYHCMQYFEGGSVCPHCGHDLFEEYEHVPYHLKRGTLLANRYIIGAVLGEGGFGITY